jgi:hypothetical protein
VPVIAGALPGVAARLEHVQFVVAGAPHLADALFAPLVRAAVPLRRPLTLVRDRTDAVLAAADVAITASGTATVQGAIHGCPMVVIYKLSPMTYRLGKPFVKVDTYAMPNLIAGTRLVPELIQDACTAARVVEDTVALAEDRSRRAVVIGAEPAGHAGSVWPGRRRRSGSGEDEMTQGMRALFLAVLVALAPAGVHATMELPVEFGEMVQGSQLVVHGRIVEVRGQQTADRRSIETIVTVAVSDALKGRPGETVTFRMPGGEVGRYRRVVVGVPQFTTGEDVIVFLRGAAPAMPTVFGLSQGLFRVGRTADGRAVVAPSVLAAPAAGAERVVRGDPARQPLPLEAFAREVRGRAGAGQ